MNIIAMSKKIKEYWSFEENSLLKPYQLGQFINFKEEIFVKK